MATARGEKPLAGDVPAFLPADLRHLLVPSDGGRVVDLGGKSVRFVLTAEQTGGRFSIVEHPVAPRHLGAPWHTHHGEDQYSYVLYGQIGARIGDEEFLGGPGTFLVKPRGVPHTFWNPADEPASVLEMVSPGGFERYFGELGDLFAAADDGTFDRQAFDALTRRYRLDLDVTSLRWLPERYGLVVDDPRA